MTSIARIACTALVCVSAALPAAAQTIFSPTAEQIAAAMDIPAANIQSVEFATLTNPAAVTVAPSWGSNLVPMAGGSLAALSNGRARTPGMAGYVSPSSGTSWGQIGLTLPITPPNAPGCNSGDPRDIVEFKVVLTVPAGAAGFSFDHNFMAIDYPEYVCTSYNDGFIAIVQSPTLGTANVAFDSMGNPTALNVAHFRAGAGTEFGTAPLLGTGYETGGATMWNTASVPASPGETVTLRLFIYDAGDTSFDSTVLVDNFTWIAQPTEPPVANAGPDVTATSSLSGVASVTLNGTASTDPEGGALAYAWTGPFGAATGPTPTVALPIGVHAITLTVTDPVGATASDGVIVTVLDGGAAALASIASHDSSIAALQAAVAALQAEVAALRQTVNGLLSHPILNSVPQAGPKK